MTALGATPVSALTLRRAQGALPLARTESWACPPRTAPASVPGLRPGTVRCRASGPAALLTRPAASRILAPCPNSTLGDWTLHTLEAGALWLDGGAMFGSVPRPLWSRTNPPDERNRIRLAMRCLLLEGHGRRVLVDVGLGDKSDAKFRDIFRVEDAPTLEDSLAAAGFGPGDVTDVVLTHLHFDHAGGATVRDEPMGCAHACPRRASTCSGATGRTRTRPIRASAPRTCARTSIRSRRPACWSSGTARRCAVAGRRAMVTAEGHTRGQQLVRVEGGGTRGLLRHRPDPDRLARAHSVRDGLRHRGHRDHGGEAVRCCRPRRGRGRVDRCSSTTPRSRSRSRSARARTSRWSERVRRGRPA